MPAGRIEEESVNACRIWLAFAVSASTALRRRICGLYNSMVRSFSGSERSMRTILGGVAGRVELEGGVLPARTRTRMFEEHARANKGAVRAYYSRTDHQGRLGSWQYWTDLNSSDRERRIFLDELCFVWISPTSGSARSSALHRDRKTGPPEIHLRTPRSEDSPRWRDCESLLAEHTR